MFSPRGIFWGAAAGIAARVAHRSGFCILALSPEFYRFLSATLKKGVLANFFGFVFSRTALERIFTTVALVRTTLAVDLLLAILVKYVEISNI